MVKTGQLPQYQKYQYILCVSFVSIVEYCVICQYWFWFLSLFFFKEKILLIHCLLVLISYKSGKAIFNGQHVASTIKSSAALIGIFEYEQWMF